MSLHRQSSGWLTPAAPAAKQSSLTQDMSDTTPERPDYHKILPSIDYFGTVGHGASWPSAVTPRPVVPASFPPPPEPVAERSR